MPLKARIRIAIAHALYAVGVLQLWQWWLLRRRAVVLMYHRVLDDQQWARTGSNPGMAVRLATFDRQMALLKQRFVPMSLERFVDHMMGRRPLPDSSCLITFDDGWLDTMTNAVPVLRRYELPAAIFLPVAFIGSRRLFTREAFTHLALRARTVAAAEPSRKPELAALLARVGQAALLDYDGPDPRQKVIDSLSAAPVDATMHALVPTLAAALGLNIEEVGDPAVLDTPDQFMTWDDVATLAGDGVTFGGHGTEHRLLARLPPAEVDIEVRTSKEALAAGPRPAVWAFSYPNGSCNAAVADTTRAHGYQVAFTIEPGAVSCDDNPMFLRRVNISESMTDSAPMFMARLVGLF